MSPSLWQGHMSIVQATCKLPDHVILIGDSGQNQTKPSVKFTVSLATGLDGVVITELGSSYHRVWVQDLLRPVDQGAQQQKPKGTLSLASQMLIFLGARRSSEPAPFGPAVSLGFFLVCPLRPPTRARVHEACSSNSTCTIVGVDGQQANLALGFALWWRPATRSQVFLCASCTCVPAYLPDHHGHNSSRALWSVKACWPP